MREVILAISNSKDLDEWVKYTKILYRQAKFDENVPQKIIDSIDSKGLTNIVSFIQALKKADDIDDETAEIVLSNTIKLFVSKHGHLDILLINEKIESQVFIQSIEMKTYNKFLTEFKWNTLQSKKRAILLVSERFWRNIGSLADIFDNIWENGKKILPVLAWDKRGIFWELIERELGSLVSFVPPINELLTLVHAFKYHKNKYIGLPKLDKLVREKGLLSRTWSKPVWIKKKIIKLLNLVEGKKSFDNFLIILTSLLEGKIFIEDVYAYILYILPIEDLEKRAEYLFNCGIILSEELLESINEKTSLNKREKLIMILNALKEAEKLWFPEISIIETLELAYGEPYTIRSLEAWLQKQFSNLLKLDSKDFLSSEKIPHELLPLLKFVVILLSSKIKPSSEVTTLLIRYILSLNNRLKYIPISLLSNVLSTIQQLNDLEIGISIYLQRFLEVHGPEPFLFLMDFIFKDRSSKVCYLGMLVNSDQGIGPRKILAKALLTPDVVKTIGKLSMKLSDLKPKGFTSPIPWELEIKFSDKTLRRAEASINFFYELGITPPKPLLYIKDIIELEKAIQPSVMNFQKTAFKELCDYYTKLIKMYGAIRGLKTYLERMFNISDIRIIRSIEHKALEIENRICKEIERRYIGEYSDLLNSDLKFVSETLSLAQELVGKDKPLILMVIDGVRYDDYINKIKPAMLEIGLKIVKDTYLLSHLPSITTLSRRSIFSGEKPPKELVFPYRITDYTIVTEEEYLKRKHPNSLYLKGSIGEIKLRLKSMVYTDEIRGKNVLAIVMSDLEKAAHGSAEGFLSHISLDYAREIAYIAKLSIETFYQVNGVKPYLVFVSDHGLEKFTKTVNFSLKELNKQFERYFVLDRVHEQVITPRYIILPINREEHADKIKVLIPKKAREEIWVKTARDLCIQKVSLKLRDEKISELINGEKIVFIFPRGDKRFKIGPSRSVVYHGGSSPSEIIVPFSIVSL